MKEKCKLYIDAMLYGDFVTKRYLYGIVFLTISSIGLAVFAILGQGIAYGLLAMLFAVVDLIWWQSMTLTSDVLEKQGDKEVSLCKKEEKREKKRKKQVEKKENATEKSRRKEDEETQDKSEDDANPKERKKREKAYSVTEEQVTYILKKSRVKKDHREVMIDHCDSLGLFEAPAYLWKDRKKYYFLILDDEKPIKLDYPLSYQTVLTHESGVRAFPDKEYRRFKIPSFISVVFESFLPDYYEKSTMYESGFCKNLYRLGKDLYFTNTSAKNVLDITGARFQVADEVTRESAHGGDFVNVYKANILWRDGVLSSKEYKERVTELLGNLAKADVGFDEYYRILNRMYEYNLITKAYVDFYLQYWKKYKAKRQ